MDMPYRGPCTRCLLQAQLSELVLEVCVQEENDTCAEAVTAVSFRWQWIGAGPITVHFSTSALLKHVVVIQSFCESRHRETSRTH